MGLLSSLLSVGGAIAGSFVGQPQLGATLGGALGGALSSSGGSSDATAAQLAALQQARDIEKGAYTDVKGYQQPYMDFGGSALNALTGRLGLNPAPAPGQPATIPDSGGTTVRQMGPTPIDTSMYGGGGLGAVAGGASKPGVVGGDPQQTVTAPTMIPSAAGPGIATPSAANALTGGPAGAAATAPGVASPGVDPGTYGSTANPTWTAPTAPAAYTPPPAFTYTASDYKASPAYQWQQDQAQKAILSSAGATGALQSGAALKELQDRAEQIALQDFNNERGFAANQYAGNRQFDYGVSRDARGDFVTDRNFGRNTYADDRNYLTDRADTQTSNLFRATGVGQTAANATSAAATRYGDQAAGLVTQGGQVQAQNALTQGNIGSNLATGIGGLLASKVGQPNALNGYMAGVVDSNPQLF